MVSLDGGIASNILLGICAGSFARQLGIESADPGGPPASLVHVVLLVYVHIPLFFTIDESAI